MATGRLQVRITTQIILPVENAQILITEADTSLLLEQKTATTNSNGLTDYIELETGIYIPEVSVDEQGNVKKLVPIRYKNRLKEVMKK